VRETTGRKVTEGGREGPRGKEKFSRSEKNSESHLRTYHLVETPCSAGQRGVSTHDFEDEHNMKPVWGESA